MSALSEDEVADLERKIAELREQLRSAAADRDAAVEQKTAATLEQFRLETELRAALDRQKASSEILRSIAATSGNAQHALQQIAETTAHFFNAPSMTIRLAEGDRWVQDIRVGSGSLASGAHPGSPLMERGATLPATVYQDNRQIHIPDLDHIDPSMAHWPAVATRAAGIRTISGTPLRREGKAIGALIIYRDRLAPFTDEELALQQSFADQAVIALENARLFNETQEALERETATSDILKVIASSPSDVQPVFDAIAESAKRLLGSHMATVTRVIDDVVHLAAGTARSQAEREALGLPYPLSSDRIHARVARAGELAFRTDIENEPGVPESIRAFARIQGYRSLLVVPMLRHGIAIGTIGITRREAGPFADKTIDLLKTFADQAVIAIENARLFNETQVALARQTATSDILRIISGSPTNVQPVFDAIVRTAVRLLGCDRTFFMRVDGNTYTPVAGVSRDGPTPLGAPNRPIDPAANFPSRAIATKQILHLPDWAQIELPEHEQRIREMFGVKSALYLPLLRGDDCIGLLILIGSRPNMFGAGEIALAESFRDQALIAIENTRLFNETKEALERQTATADILKVIASSPSDVQPVFEAILVRALSLCEAAFGFLTAYDGQRFAFGAQRGVPETLAEHFRAGMDEPRPGDAHWRLIQGEDLIHNLDQKDEDAYRAGNPLRRATVDLGGARSALVVALRKGASLRGAITIYRKEVRPFSESQITLLRHFADQAVIAIENVRLFNETQEALERQTATADILKVIASSPSDAAPVFEAIVASANRLLGGFSSTVYRFIDGLAYLEAFTPTTPEADEILTSTFPLPVDRFAPFEIAQTGEVTQIADTETLTGEILAISRARGFRSMLFAPLVNKGTSIGIVVVTRATTGTFADHHVQLLKTFADQAVIAIENVRLFDEVQAKTHDLEEALQVQTASADVLKVISRSPDALQPVFDVIVETSRELCRAQASTIFTLRDGRFYFVAFAGAETEFLQHIKDHPISVDQRGSALARSARERRTIHIPNTAEDPEFGAGGIIGMGEPRATLTVPLMREGQVIGGITLRQSNVTPFTQRQIEAIETFADQAVIAIENTRLFDEVQAKTRDLEETLQQQTATSEVLQTISSSPGELGPVFDKMLENATRICGAGFGSMTLVEGDTQRQAALYNAPPAFAAVRKNKVLQIHPRSSIAAAIRTKQVVQVEDLRNYPSYLEGNPASVQLVELGGARTLVVVPMLRDDEVIGAITVYRQNVRLFGEKQIDLLTNFARQAVIAIENARLLGELRQRTADLSKSLDDLRTAQGRLIQTEKLASLGQLTAGIAHEIKNPLNFVNNFSALSVELTDELNDLLKQATLADKLRGEVDELTTLLKDNLSKVVQHGKRADSIVKNMLLHSREGSGEHRPADVNALVDESLNLAYHGARAEKPQFNVTLQRDFDPGAGMVEAFPQEITRVLLNLITNGFYAVTKRKADNGATGFEPLLTASTKGHGDRVEIRIRDNGTGIPPDVKEKMFNPFFTTKPAGEGTGLGLSMSHDIIVKQHGGTIDVDTVPGEFTEFTVVLPRHKI